MDTFDGVNGLGDAEDLKFCLDNLGRFDDFRHFAHAAGAGGKPEVNEGNFVFKSVLVMVLPCGGRAGRTQGRFVAGDKDEGKKRAN